MNSLLPAEKKAHDKAIEAFVDRINNQVMPAHLIGKITLNNVAYGVKVDNAYFYFDFPYSYHADKLNQDLKNNEAIKGLDVILHSKFYNSYRLNKNGYIAYTYRYKSANKSYWLNKVDTNMAIEAEHLRRYLPIVDCAVEPKDTYLADVHTTDQATTCKRVLVLCRWPHMDESAEEDLEDVGYLPDQKNVIITTFEISDPEIVIDQALVDLLHEQILYFIDVYFTSPVAQKIMSERRKSEVLAYHHSIDNLELDSYINFLDDLQTGKSMDFVKLGKCVMRYRVLRLLHYLLFQVEYLHSGDPGLNKGHTVFELAEKKVSEIIECLVANYNLYHINFNIVKGVDLHLADFEPNAGIKVADPEFYDIILIIWNLMQNAAIMARRQEITQVVISLDNSDGRLCLSFKNMGKMLREYITFIMVQDAEYPQLNSNPNKKYRGLEIVKDKCRSFNRNWELEAYVNEEDHKWYTTVSVTF